MRIPSWFASPPPATGWALDTAMGAVVRRQGKAELRCAATDFPIGTFEVGPVGLQAVDEEKMRPVLARLHGEVKGSRRVAVVVPTGWLRSHLLEFDHLPRRRIDVHDTVVWRLKKLLPVVPSSLRLAIVPQPPGGGRRRLLVTAGVERAIAGLESAFASVGISPGIITSRIFAVADGADAGSPVLTIQQERGFLSLLLLIDDAPRVVRTKPVPNDDWPVIERELGLTLNFIRSTLEIGDPLAVQISCDSADISDRIRDWSDRTGGLSTRVRPPGSMGFEGTAVRDRVGAHRLDPVVHVMEGGVRCSRPTSPPSPTSTPGRCGW
jgi:hypothetical protein